MMRSLKLVAGPGAVLARRLLAGQIRRAEWLRLADSIDWTTSDERPPQTPVSENVASLPSAGAATDAGAATLKAGGAAAPELSLWTSKESYALGDVVTINAVADRSCYLTVISIDRIGAATVVFPNSFQRDNQLKPGEVMELPGATAPFTFRASERGRETIVGICDPSVVPPLAITPDWERRRFTVLGNWNVYVNGAYAGSPPVLLAPVRPANRVSRYRRRGNKAPVQPPQADPFSPAGRAAVVYDVR